jgi:cellulose biosynthesis protein BcsQ
VHLVIIDYRPEFRAALIGRAREAIRQAGLKRFQPYEVDRFHLDRFDWSLSSGAIIGPGCEHEIVQVIADVREKFPVGKIGVVLKKEQYRAQATDLRIEYGVYPIPEGDLAQIVSFVIECDRVQGDDGQEFKNRGIVGLVHFKGGVGCSSISAALAACWARHDLQVALLDFDDVTPNITHWSQAEEVHRMAVSNFIRMGQVPPGRLNEVLYPVEGYRGRMFVVPQPEHYGDSFHFKSNAIPDAPGIRTYIESLFQELKREFDVVVVDLGRSWGISTFVSLSMCQKVILVCDDDPSALRQTVRGCERLVRETNNDALLGIKNWNIVMNSYTGQVVTPREFQQQFELLDIFSPSTSYPVVPYSRSGRFWGNPGITLYELSDEATQEKLIQLALLGAAFVRQKPKSSFSFFGWKK